MVRNHLKNMKVLSTRTCNTFVHRLVYFFVPMYKTYSENLLVSIQHLYFQLRLQNLMYTKVLEIVRF